MDEIARSLPGELPDEIGEAGVGVAGASNARNGFIGGLGEFSFDVAARTITLDYNERYTATEFYSHEF